MPTEENFDLEMSPEDKNVVIICAAITAACFAGMAFIAHRQYKRDLKASEKMMDETVQKADEIKANASK